MFGDYFDAAYTRPSGALGGDPIQLITDVIHPLLNDLKGAAGYSDDLEQYGYLLTHAIQAMCFAYAARRGIGPEQVMQTGMAYASMSKPVADAIDLLDKEFSHYGLSSSPARTYLSSLALAAGVAHASSATM
jgi:hypothetical protein